MTIWKTAALGAALAAAAGVGALVTPTAHGQTRVVRTQSPRALEIFSGGSRIGVSIRDREEADGTAAKGVTGGVIVDEVTTESPAEKAGIRKGDVIVEFDGERVRSARQLTRIVQETPPGRTVQAAIVRDGQRSTVSITPREGSGVRFEGLDDLANLHYKLAPTPPRPPDAPRPPSPPAVWKFDEFVGRSGNRLGMSVSTLSPQLAEYFGTKEGVLVSSVTDNSAAAKAGVKAGDVITSFNGTVVNDPSDVRGRVADLSDGDEFSIAVMRDKKPVTLKGKAERPERRRTTSRTIL
jgi:membrane-associated protease RseP (regulator of RpoE activity)